MEKLYGLDLFSGIGGISIALDEWVDTVAYCERDRYAQAVLLSRMAAGDIDWAPIWDDVTTLRGDMLPRIDIIFGGFPCQDISVAGAGKGLEGERSGLFFEVVRLAKEIKPAFLFLENVPAIRTRGLDRVIQELTEAGYDCRWTMLSAANVGANHKRARWFLLAYRKSERLQDGCERLRGVRSKKCETDESTSCSKTRNAAYSPRQLSYGAGPQRKWRTESSNGCAAMADAKRPGLEGNVQSTEQPAELCRVEAGWWAIEPNVGRVANGIPCRVDRLRCLGNAVVPQQAKEAFKELMGLK